MASRPLYRQIADHVRKEINSGKYGPGDQIESERELVERFGAARNTVRAGLAVLVSEGLIAADRARGYYVREQIPFTYFASRSENLMLPEPVTTEDSFTSDVRNAGRQPHQEFSLTLVPATADVAERLRLDEGDSCILRSCLRYVDGTPWSIQETWYPRKLAEQAPRLEEPADIAEGTTRYLAGNGFEQVGYWDEWTTRMPNPTEVRKLELGAGTPVLICTRTGYTVSEPIRVTITTFAGDRNRIVYESGNLAARTEADEDLLP